MAEPPGELLKTLNGADAALVGVVLLSLLVGWVRGFAFEVLSLLGWLAAWFVAVVYSPQWAIHLPVGPPASRLNLAATLIATFIATLILWGLGARLVRLLIHATPLSLIDRVLGSLFGLLRGLVIGLTVAALLPLTPWANGRIWRDSAIAGLLDEALAELRPLWPSWQRAWPAAKQATQRGFP